MADELSLILSALESSDKAAKEENPYSFLSDVGSGTGDLIMKGAASGKWDVGESALGSFVAGLLGGFGDNLGNSYVNKQNQLAQDYLMNGGDRPEGINDSVFKSVSKSRSIFDLANKLESSSDERKGNIEGRKTLLQALGSANTPAQQERILKYGQMMGLVPGDANLGSVGAANTPAKEPEIKSLFPGESLTSKRIQLLKQNMDMGLPGGAAQKETEDQLAPFRAANKETTDKVSTARERAKNLSEIANIADQGVSGAGETGGLLNPLRELASKAYAVISPEERQQRADQSLLDSIKPQMVGVSRSPGATSDVEFTTYIGSGPSSQRTPEENKALIEKLKNLATLEDEYASFLEAYRAEKGTTMPTPGSPGAEVLWKQYLKENPALVRTPDGQLEWNPSRTDWRQFFMNGAGAGASAPTPAGYEIRINPQTGKKYKVLLGQ